MKNQSTKNTFHVPGIEALLANHIDWLRNGRIGLIAHPASVDSAGQPTAEQLYNHPALNLAALLGPEHGYAGTAAAGIKVKNGQHPLWNIPVYSLYGKTRKPDETMLRDIDILLFDLQDLPVRCYTYSSTLRYAMQAAAEYDCRFVVADRPAPLFRVVDGPPLSSVCESFVGMVNTPYCYGLTSGETARMIQTEELPQLDLHIAKCQPTKASRPSTALDSSHWIPPSPSLKYRMNALTYPITVCCEALPALDYGKGTENAFRIIGAPWINAEKSADALNTLHLPGLSTEAIRYRPQTGPYSKQEINGLRFTVHESPALKPAAAMYAILLHLQQEYGQDRLWQAEGTRPEFFDKLLGNSSVRENLLANQPLDLLQEKWHHDHDAFLKRTQPFRIYP